MDEHRGKAEFGRTGSTGQPEAIQLGIGSRPGDLRGDEHGPGMAGAGGADTRQQRSAMRDIGEKIERSEAGRALREESRELGGELKHYAEDAARSGRDQIASRLHHMSDALHRAADTLREEDEEVTGRFADQAASQVDRVYDYLRSHEPGDLIQDVDRLARRQPMLFIGGALVAGVLLSRFLRSSAPHDDFRGGSDVGFDQQNLGRGPQAQARSPVGEPRRVEVGGSSSASRPTAAPQDHPITSRPLTEPPRNDPGFGGPGGGL